MTELVRFLRRPQLRDGSGSSRTMRQRRRTRVSRHKRRLRSTVVSARIQRRSIPMGNTAASFRRKAVGIAGLAASLMALGTGQAQLLGGPALPALPLPGSGETPTQTPTGEA